MNKFYALRYIALGKICYWTNIHMFIQADLFPLIFNFSRNILTRYCLRLTVIGMIMSTGMTCGYSTNHNGVDALDCLLTVEIMEVSRAN